jgi:hypothetical protein
MKKKNKTNPNQPTIVNRYTSLPMLLDIIHRNAITLLPPDAWNDRNDREVMLEYKRRRNLTCLVAICFSAGEETVHHWNAFASGSAGCRIEFHLPTLLEGLSRDPGYRHGKVVYKPLRGIQKSDLAESKMPFVKRWPYRIEEEYRIVYERSDPAASHRTELNIPISLECIRSITVSQAMPESVFKSIKSQLGTQLGKRISRSTLFESKMWINKFKSKPKKKK